MKVLSFCTKGKCKQDNFWWVILFQRIGELPRKQIQINAFSFILFVFASWWYAESTSVRGDFEGALRRSYKILWIQRTVVLLTFWRMKIEKRDIAIDTELNLFEREAFVTEKMVLKQKLTVFECRRDRSIDIYIWPTFAHISDTY